MGQLTRHENKIIIHSFSDTQETTNTKTKGKMQIVSLAEIRKISYMILV